MKDKNYLILFGLVWFVVASFITIHFMVFYKLYELPFGRNDVDNYIGTTYKWITGEKYNISHMLFMVAGAAAYNFGVRPELLFSILMPVALGLIPVAAFMFYVYMTKSAKIAFVSFVFMVFGTFSMFSFWIMSLWGQAISTALLMLALVFYDLAVVSDKRYYIAFGVAVIFAMLAHYISPFMIILFLLLKFIDEKKTIDALSIGVVLFIGLIVMVFFMENDRFSSSYPVVLGPVYIFDNAAMILVWFLSIYGMIASRKDAKLRVLSWFTIIGIIASSQFVLWRPIVTILCFVAMFAGIGLIKILGRLSKVYVILVYIMVAVLLLNYSYAQYAGFMNMMLWEMIDNSPDPPRSIDPQPFRGLFFSGNEIQVMGYITQFSNSTHERSRIVDNGTVGPVLITGM